MDFTLTFLKLFLYGLTLAIPLLFLFAVLIIVTGQIVGRKESWTRFDSLYWSFITATTVGYGDIRPTKNLSKLLSILIAFIGLVFTGIVVALAIHAASAALKENKDMSVIQEKVEHIKNSSR